MGGSSSSKRVWTEEELSFYEDLTFLNHSEILHAFNKFRSLDPDLVSKDKNVRLPKHTMLKLPELSGNPFRYRIVKVFSSTKNGCMTFEDFIDMLSVFSDKAPKSVKMEYAFRIYDFNEDDQICRKDIQNIVETLCGGSYLTDETMDNLVEEIFDECDLDEDELLSYNEFEQVVSMNPDFMQTFRFKV